MDGYIPIFTIIQFVFYVGWLKVGVVIYNSTLQGRNGVSDIWAKMRFLHISMCISSSMMHPNFRVQNLWRMKVRSSKEQEEQ